jgi:uncharacterized protein (TIGR03435 family)
MPNVFGSGKARMKELKEVSIRLLAAVLLGMASRIFSQSPVSPADDFVAASIRPSGPHSPRGWDGGPGSDSPDLYRLSSATLLDLITTAWNVHSFQVSSRAPLDRNHFDLVARIPSGTTKERFRKMLQNLLIERFALKEHTESKDFSAYELVLATPGSKFKRTGPDQFTLQSKTASDQDPEGARWPELPPNLPDIAIQKSVAGDHELIRVSAQLEPLSALVESLPSPDGLPVVDHTALTGKFSFRLEYSQDLPGTISDSAAAAPAIFTALREQLGLELIKKKLPFDVVVVDSFERSPTPN